VWARIQMLPSSSGGINSPPIAKTNSNTAPIIAATATAHTSFGARNARSKASAYRRAKKRLSHVSCSASRSSVSDGCFLREDVAQHRSEDQREDQRAVSANP